MVEGVVGGGDRLKNRCTIVMYHYVRELQYTHYPKIKGLNTTLFYKQMKYLKNNYNFVTHADIIDAIYENKSLPKNAVWLTFDDAYIDHYLNVFPILDEMGIEGAFFPPVKAIEENKVLDVNKIHFILAATDEIDELINTIKELLQVNQYNYNLNTFDFYWEKLAEASRFDPKEIIFIKRLLQVELPEELRNEILNELFAQYVAADESAFSRELYMNEDQIKTMLRHGMCVGCHGYDHYWLDSLPVEKQVSEIEKSLSFLKKIGVNENDWVMCYPYGAYDNSLINVIKESGCKLGVTTDVGVAELINGNQFTLPRIDTVDLPR